MPPTRAENTCLRVRTGSSRESTRASASFRFWINGGRIADLVRNVDREALTKNERPYVCSYFPPGKGQKARPFVALKTKPSRSRRSRKPKRERT